MIIFISEDFFKIIRYFYRKKNRAGRLSVVKMLLNRGYLVWDGVLFGFFARYDKRSTLLQGGGVRCFRRLPRKGTVRDRL